MHATVMMLRYLVSKMSVERERESRFVIILTEE